ncbi:hypothetical protein [Bradyrhizobium sp. LMG 9283]|uniref:hypothetical protein n=1 Tax=Bradyrhizobium sp. LMG 9283 TaxID=592064 RepID=UPI00388DBBB4
MPNANQRSFNAAWTILDAPLWGRDLIAEVTSNGERQKSAGRSPWLAEERQPDLPQRPSDN